MGQIIQHRSCAFGFSGFVASVILLCCPALASDGPSERHVRAAFGKYESCRTNFASGKDVAAAWKFAAACFDWADFASNDTQRAAIAQQGIDAANQALQANPESAAAHYYLAMNLGQLARTKTLGALRLVREMERHFKRAIALDPSVDHAGPARSLGMLYLQAPGWPASIGSRSKAREFLKQAVTLDPNHPDNHLRLMEAYLEMEDSRPLREAMEAYRKLLPQARLKLVGPEWEEPWESWTARWAAIEEKASASE